MQAICVRDICLDNILLAEPLSADNAPPTAKLYNFGWSKDEALDSQACTKAGTFGFQAPEILTGEGEAPYDGDAADAWSLGVVLYYLIYGYNPFYPERRGVNAAQIDNRIVANEYTFPENRPGVSEQTRQLISEMLQKDPSTRLKVGSLLHDPRYQNILGTELIEYNLALQMDQGNGQRQNEVIRKIENAKQLFDDYIRCLTEGDSTMMSTHMSSWENSSETTRMDY